MSFLATRPGLHTDQTDPPFAREARAAGFEWIAVQMQNGRDSKRARSLAGLRSAGFVAGAWGVSYSDSRSISLADDARQLREVAEETGSAFVIMNVEHPFDPKPLIDAFATYAKPKAVIVTVGIMQQIGARALIAAGWDVQAETYLNDQTNLTPLEAEWQALNAGIPSDRLNCALGWYSGLLGRCSASRYVAALKDAHSDAAFSGWMLEHLDPSTATAELNTFGEYLRSLAPAPPPPEPPAPKYPWLAHRDAALAELEEAERLMREAGTSAAVINRSRIGIARDVLACTDAELNTYRTKLGV